MSINRLLKNAHLPFDRLMALSKVEGRRFPHSSSLRRIVQYASLLGISGALHLDVFEKPVSRDFFSNLQKTRALQLFVSPSPLSPPTRGGEIGFRKASKSRFFSNLQRTQAR